ncbi:MAG TPA: hypothetical protein VGM39_22000 [Kofleriaceae bacterium]|jgi:outer membrane protein TolC
MRGRAALIAILFAGCFHPAPHSRLDAPALRTQADASAPQPKDWDLDVDEAVAYARDHAPAFADRRDQETIADAQISAAKQLTNPQIRIGQTTEEDVLIGPQTDLVVALRVFPDMPWALDAKVAGARANLDAERAMTLTAMRGTIAKVRQLYAQLAFGDLTAQLLRAQRDVLTERRRVLDEQVAHNRATNLEVLLAQQEAADVESTLSSIDMTSAQKRAEIASLIGIPAGQVWKPVVDLDKERVITTDLDTRSLEQRALGRPELAELAARADAADANAYRERTKRIPWLDSVQVERRIGDQAQWAVSASVSVPIFSFNSGAIAAADAQRGAFTRERERLATETLRELDSAVEIAIVTGKRAQTLTEQLGPMTAAIDEILAAEKTAAVTDPVKLLLLQERYVRSQRAALEAAFDHRMAIIALDALVGDP